MGEEPESIRRDIAATRERMGETLDALGSKAHAPQRALQAVGERTQSARETVTAGGRRAMEESVERGRQVRSLAGQHPLAVGLGAAAAGLVVVTFLLVLRGR